MTSTTDMTAVVLMAPARQKAGSSYCMGASRLAANGDHMAACEGIVAPARHLCRFEKYSGCGKPSLI
jgi:hypothetical protein